MPEARSRRHRDSFRDFEPRQYLDEYYGHIGDENDALLRLLATAYRDFDDKSITILELGGGPTLYQLISAARPASSVLFTDLLPENLEEVELALIEDPGGLDWYDFIHRALQYEGTAQPSQRDIQERRELLRNSVTQFDIRSVLEDSPEDGQPEVFDVVSAHFVAESITANRHEWERAIRYQLGHLRPGGHYISSGLLGADRWVIGDDSFAAVNLDESTVLSTLVQLGLTVLSFDTIEAEHTVPSAAAHQGYTGMYVVKAKK